MRPPSPASELGPGQDRAAAVGEGGAPGPTLAAWRARGLHRFDPIQFRFIEALARRAADRRADQAPHQLAEQPADQAAEQSAEPTASARRVQQVQQVLQDKLATLMAAYEQRQAQALADAQAHVDQAVARFPAATDRLRQGLAGGDFKALRRLIASLEDPAPARWLADLVHHVDRQASPSADGRPADGRPADPASASAGMPSGPPAELKAVRDFKSTWARLSVDQQLTRSLARIPRTGRPAQLAAAGAALAAADARGVAGYLSRFMSYVDALLWLDEAGAPGRIEAGRHAPRRRRQEAQARPRPGRVDHPPATVTALPAAPFTSQTAHRPQQRRGRKRHGGCVDSQAARTPFAALKTLTTVLVIAHAVHRGSQGAPLRRALPAGLVLPLAGDVALSQETAGAARSGAWVRSAAWRRVPRATPAAGASR